ncbi:MAG: hypothetical protein WCT01_02155 [Candidatus Shapirobacteria bacterium]
MTTIVNNPPPVPQNTNNGLGPVVALISILLLGALFYIYGLPALRRANFGSTPQINVPNQIDVNINPSPGDTVIPPTSNP